MYIFFTSILLIFDSSCFIPFLSSSQLPQIAVSKVGMSLTPNLSHPLTDKLLCLFPFSPLCPKRVILLVLALLLGWYLGQYFAVVPLGHLSHRQMDAIGSKKPESCCQHIHPKRVTKESFLNRKEVIEGMER